MDDAQLAHAIKMKYGTAPNEPNDGQLAAIKSDVRAFLADGGELTDEVIMQVVRSHCPRAGSFGYHGADMSDVKAMLRLAIAAGSVR